MSLPMTTRCRCVPLENSLPAAMPTLSAISEVIGALLASPRMPSVPKYRRDMCSLASLARRAQAVAATDPCRPPLCRCPAWPSIKSCKQRLHQLWSAKRYPMHRLCRAFTAASIATARVHHGASPGADVGRPPRPPGPGAWRQHRARAGSARPARRRGARRRCEPGRRSAASAPVSLPMKLLREAPSRIGAAEPVEDAQGAEQRQVVGQRLAEADAGVDDQPRARDAGTLAGLDAGGEPIVDVEHDVGIARIVLHGARDRPGRASARPAGRSRPRPARRRDRASAPRRR